MIHDKSGQISILKSMGATQRGIMSVFLVQGVIIGGVGAFVGCGLGLGLSLLVRAAHYPLDPEVYLINELPVHVNVGESVVVACLALLLTTLTCVYSARRAGKVAPVQGLRRID